MKNNFFVTSAALDVPHGFLKRHGGVSQGIYDSLNCGYRHDRQGAGFDAEENVVENRRRAITFVGGSFKNLCLAKQVHGSDCLVVTKPEQGDREGDALVTNKPDLVLGVQTADCVPVLFYEKKAQVIGAAHAGWKGALKGILQSTVRTIESLGGVKEHITAVIGPCIDQQSYEMGAEVFDDFTKQDPQSKAFFVDGNKPDKFLFDLPGYVAFCLKQAGVLRIEDVGLSTYTHEEMFFSCRRAFHQGHPGFGNQLSLIFMKTDT